MGDLARINGVAIEHSSRIGLAFSDRTFIVQQTIKISDHLAGQIEQYLQQHPEVTLSDLIEEALEQGLTLNSVSDVPGLNNLSAPTIGQVERFMALSGIVKDAPLHSDEHAEDFVN